MSLLGFQARFPFDAECVRYLLDMRFPDGFACPKCGSVNAGKITTRGLWQCKDCRRQTSLTAGTMFHRTRTPLRQWFWAVFLVARDKRGHSALQLGKELGIPYTRAWLMLHKIRAAMAHRDLRYMLDGIVEMDEAYFGAPEPGVRGRGTGRAKAIVAVSLSDEGKPRFARIQVVRRIDARRVKKFAAAAIAPGSTIRTDGLNVYRCLEKRYIHKPVIATKTGKEGILKWVHVIISNAKAFITGTFHGLDSKHLQRYLDEFCYRFNRRTREPELFDRLLLACASAPPITFDELTE
jgi:transposase-like protein